MKARTWSYEDNPHFPSLHFSSAQTRISILVSFQNWGIVKRVPPPGTKVSNMVIAIAAPGNLSAAMRPALQATTCDQKKVFKCFLVDFRRSVTRGNGFSRFSLRHLTAILEPQHCSYCCEYCVQVPSLLQQQQTNSNRDQFQQLILVIANRAFTKTEQKTRQILNKYALLGVGRPGPQSLTSRRPSLKKCIQAV